MKQKIVMKVHMNCQKCRTKALKVVAAANGVNFVGLEGEEKDKLVVIGDGVDAVKLTHCLRKKVGRTDIVVEEWFGSIGAKHKALNQKESPAGDSSADDSSADGGVLPLGKGDELTPSDCEDSVHNDVSDANSAHAGCVDSKVKLNNGCVDEYITEKKALNVGRKKRKETVQLEERGNVAIEEKKHRTCVAAKLSNGMGLMDEAHNQCKPLAAHDCFMGQDHPKINELAGFCKDGANSKANSNVSHILADSTSNNISRILNSDRNLRSNHEESVTKKSLCKGVDFGGVGAKSLEYRMKKMKEYEASNRSAKPQMAINHAI